MSDRSDRVDRNMPAAMKIVHALRDGVRRVDAAPAVLGGVFLVTMLAALPLALTLRGMLAGHLAGRPAADMAASGVNFEWWQEFSAQAAGIGASFAPSVIGFGAVLDNLSALLDNDEQSTAIVMAVGAYLLVWTFLVGGILDRYARNRPIRANGFFAACGIFVFRFLRLGVVMAIVYYALFRFLHWWLFEKVFADITRDLTVERTAFFWRLGLYAIFGALLVGFNLLFDYAKIRAVVEDRRSMVGAVAAAWRFLRRHAAQAAGLYLMNGLLFVAVVSLYAAAAPGAGGGGWSMWAGFLVGQIYLLARLWVKLVFYASQTALFQAELAHAGYTAGPAPLWPESAGAEAIVNAARR